VLEVLTDSGWVLQELKKITRLIPEASSSEVRDSGCEVEVEIIGRGLGFEMTLLASERGEQRCPLIHVAGGCGESDRSIRDPGEECEEERLYGLL
jgi:hypothetical protein